MQAEYQATKAQTQHAPGPSYGLQQASAACAARQATPGASHAAGGHGRPALAQLDSCGGGAGFVTANGLAWGGQLAAAAAPAGGGAGGGTAAAPFSHQPAAAAAGPSDRDDGRHAVDLCDKGDAAPGLHGGDDGSGAVPEEHGDGDPEAEEDTGGPTLIDVDTTTGGIQLHR